jgi:hypothetical protein
MFWTTTPKPQIVEDISWGLMPRLEERIVTMRKYRVEMLDGYVSEIVAIDPDIAAAKAVYQASLLVEALSVNSIELVEV